VVAHVPVPEYEIKKLLGGNTIDACAVYRRELWQQLGGYDEEMTGFEDWEYWLRAGIHGWRFCHLPVVAQDYRVRANSLLDHCLEGENQHRLCHYIRNKHAELYHSHLPWYWRGCSIVFGSIMGPRRLNKVREQESRSYWGLVWFLYGPGGVFGKDTTRRRRGRRSPRR
jgi:hypothetical protein